MTKEEYEKLLKSDYWKGFSYSLIKERNFTCEDCGRQFPNQRNKLDVHHLVYRDINPWSYKPEEMIVLCEKCHKKRHGLYFEPEPENQDNSSLDSVSANDFQHTQQYENKDNSSYDSFSNEPHKEPKWKYIYYGALFLLLFALLFSWGWDKLSNKSSNNSEEIMVEQTDQPSEEKTKTVKSSKSKEKKPNKETTPDDNDSQNDKNESPNKIDINVPSATTNRQEKATVKSNSTSTRRSQNNIPPDTIFIIEDSFPDDTWTRNTEPEPYITVDVMPSYPGGDAALLKYVMNEIVYPESAKEKKIQGRVFIRFCVTQTGEIGQVQVLRGVDPEIDAEAVRAVKTIKGFKPGRLGGIAVPVWYLIPIDFKLLN